MQNRQSSVNLEKVIDKYRQAVLYFSQDVIYELYTF